MKAARFEVRRAVPLEERSLLALAGSILEGMPRIGMTASLEDGDEFREHVHGVEFFEDDAGETAPALTFEYSGDEELDRWTSIRWPDRVLRLET